MSTIINGTSSAITFPDTTVQNTAFTTGAVTQSTIGTNVGATGPAFSAYQSTLTALANNTYTKVLFQSEEFDTNSNYDTSLSRFQPTVAGYYQLNSAISFAGTPSTETVLALYKNGSVLRYLQDLKMTTIYSFSGNALVYANGTTDYFEIYAYQSTGVTMNTNPFFNSTFFQGAMVRAA